MNLQNRISECRRYETDRLPRYLKYLRDEFRGLRRGFELMLEREKYEMREGLTEKLYV